MSEIKVTPLKFIGIENEYMTISGCEPIMLATDALALADAIYLAAGRLPRVEDEYGYSALQELSQCPQSLINGTFLGSMSDYNDALKRLRDYGLAVRDGDSRYYSTWSLTPAGIEFVKQWKEEGND